MPTVTADTEMVPEILAGTGLTIINESCNTGSVTNTHWWLLQDGNAIGYLHTMTRRGETDYAFRFCDIEIRESHRGQRLARTMTIAAEQVTGMTIWHGGEFTPSGNAAIAPWLRRDPNYPPGRIGYDEDLSFVFDWDERLSRYPV